MSEILSRLSFTATQNSHPTQTDIVIVGRAVGVGVAGNVGVGVTSHVGVGVASHVGIGVASNVGGGVRGAPHSQISSKHGNPLSLPFAHLAQSASLTPTWYWVARQLEHLPQAGRRVGSGVSPMVGLGVGHEVGRRVGSCVGIGVSLCVGLGVGKGVGLGVGLRVGLCVGLRVGLRVGCGVGIGVGCGVGIGVARGVGIGVGCGVGIQVGCGVGIVVGCCVGFGVGCRVGIGVGLGVGFGVGRTLSQPKNSARRAITLCHLVGCSFTLVAVIGGTMSFSCTLSLSVLAWKIWFCAVQFSPSKVNSRSNSLTHWSSPPLPV